MCDCAVLMCVCEWVAACVSCILSTFYLRRLTYCASFLFFEGVLFIDYICPGLTQYAKCADVRHSEKSKPKNKETKRLDIRI